MEHIVLLKTRKDVDQKLVVAMIENVGLLKQIPGVVTASLSAVNKNVYPGFEDRSQGWTHVLRVLLTAPHMLQIYAPHPAHVAFRDKFVGPACSDKLVVDFPTSEAHLPYRNPWSHLPVSHRSPGRISTTKRTQVSSVLVLQESSDKPQPIAPPLLFTPISFRGLTLKNRIAVSPMCQYSSPDGFMTDWHLRHLGSFAVGGAGLVICEATGVTSEGRITPYCTGIYHEEHITPMKRIVEFVHAHDCPIGIQLAHAGRKASTQAPFIAVRDGGIDAADGGWPDRVAGPSPIPWSDTYIKPHELSKAEIKEVVQAFVIGAQRAERAGFDMIELHAAHGYLMSSFLSPLSNKRTDEYGGSLENRMRLCLEVASTVRSMYPKEKPIFVRISCKDWVEGGWDVPDSIALAKKLYEIGIDLVDCSSAGNSPDQMKQLRAAAGPGFQVPFAEAIKREIKALKTGAVGEITEPWQAEEILQSNKADLIFIARQFLREPYWPYRAARELGVDIDWTPQLERAKIPSGPRPVSNPTIRSKL